MNAEEIEYAMKQAYCLGYTMSKSESLTEPFHYMGKEAEREVLRAIHKSAEVEWDSAKLKLLVISKMPTDKAD